jgi:hypothetical protein
LGGFSGEEKNGVIGYYVYRVEKVVDEGAKVF